MVRGRRGRRRHSGEVVVGPLSCWRQSSGEGGSGSARDGASDRAGSPAAPRSPALDYLGDGHALIRSGLLFYASLYRAGRQMGWTPSQVDACELWQFAAALGLHEPEEDEGEESPPTGARPVRSGRGVQRGSVNGVPTDTVIARLRHAAGEGPPPKPKPASNNAAGFAVMAAGAKRGMVIEEVVVDAD